MDASDAHRVVAGILRCADQMLLCHRAPGRAWYPNAWDFPGGHIEPGEDPLAALRRELEEELGIEIQTVSSEPVAHIAGIDLDLRVYAVNSWEGQVRNRCPNEHDKLQWLRPRDLEGMEFAHPAIPAILRELSTGAPDRSHRSSPRSEERDRFGWADWAWDVSLFEGSAGYYRRGRIPYAEGLADSLASALDLDGHGRLLDVGCGPGIIALRLAHLFHQAIGLDPDAGMLEEARRAPREQRITNVSWILQRAEDLPAGMGTFRVITFAQSFHWMDRPKVSRAVRAMIEPDGAVVQIDPGRDGIVGDPAPGPHPAVPFEAIDSLRRSYLGPDRRAGQGFRNTSPSGEDLIFQAAGFLPEIRVPLADNRVLDRSIDDLVAWVFSASSTAPHLFGNKLGQFEDDLRALLDQASPSGHFSVPLSDTTMRIRRPSGNAGPKGLSTGG